MSAQDNIQTVKDIYAAFNRDDRNAMIAALAENVEFESDPGASEIPRGRSTTRALGSSGSLEPNSGTRQNWWL